MESNKNKTANDLVELKTTEEDQIIKSLNNQDTVYDL